MDRTPLQDRNPGLSEQLARTFVPLRETYHRLETMILGGDIEGIEQAAKEGVDFSFFLSNHKPLIEIAIDSGKPEIADVILPRLGYDAAGIFDTLRKQAGQGNTEWVGKLMQKCNCTHDDSMPLVEAAEKGHLDCLTLLLPKSEPKRNDSFGLRLAAGAGHKDCVIVLLPHSETLGRARAMMVAIDSNHIDIAREIAAYVSTEDIENLVLRVSDKTREQKTIAKSLIDEQRLRARFSKEQAHEQRRTI